MSRTDTSVSLPIAVVAFAAATALLLEVTAPLRDREMDVSSLMVVLGLTIVNGAFLRADLRRVDREQGKGNG